MNRDRFAVFAVLLALILTIALFVVIWLERPPQNPSLFPGQANGSLNNTMSDDYMAIINASTIMPATVDSAITSQMNESHGLPLLLKILKINHISTGYESYYYRTFDVCVLRSNDSAYKEGLNFSMVINEKMTGYFGMIHGIAPGELEPGIIIEITDYSLFDGNLSVTVSADPYNTTAWDNAWKQKITIIGQAKQLT